jgi:hypothetical protein
MLHAREHQRFDKKTLVHKSVECLLSCRLWPQRMKIRSHVIVRKNQGGKRTEP